MHMLEVIKIITQIRKLLFLPWQSISKHAAAHNRHRDIFVSDAIPLSGGFSEKSPCIIYFAKDFMDIIRQHT